jgi:hypothetical protein
MISHDPDEAPEMPPNMARDAEALGMQPIHVICMEKGSSDPGVSFYALTPFMPRTGDRIDLEDGKTCEVARTYFRIVRHGNLVLSPNVIAYRVQ